MIKRILLTALLLFVPVFASHCETVVIGSTASLTEKNLPLDVDLLYDSFYNQPRVDSQNCELDISYIYDLFINGKMKIPFSSKQLLKVCRKKITSPYLKENEYFSMRCREQCSGFVLSYIQGIIEKSNMIKTTGNKKK